MPTLSNNVGAYMIPIGINNRVFAGAGLISLDALKKKKKKKKKDADDSSELVQSVANESVDELIAESKKKKKKKRGGYVVNGKSGKWRTVSGNKIFFPDDSGTPVGMPSKMSDPKKAASDKASDKASAKKSGSGKSKNKTPGASGVKKKSGKGKKAASGGGSGKKSNAKAGAVGAALTGTDDAVDKLKSKKVGGKKKGNGEEGSAPKQDFNSKHMKNLQRKLKMTLLKLKKAAKNAPAGAETAIRSLLKAMGGKDGSAFEKAGSALSKAVSSIRG